MPTAVRVQIERMGAFRSTSQDSRIAAVVRTGVLRVLQSISRYVRGWKVLLSIPFDFESVRYIAFDQSRVGIGGKWGIREGWGSRHKFSRSRSRRFKRSITALTRSERAPDCAANVTDSALIWSARAPFVVEDK